MNDKVDSPRSRLLRLKAVRMSQKPYVSARELLDTANASSGPARNAWLTYLGLLAYLLVTLAGVTHVDLLLDSPITLPIVGVKIPLFSFFIFAPLLLLIVHLGLLVQHAILGHKYNHFHRAIKDQEERENLNPDRRLVHNYVFSQLLAGPQPPFPLGQMLRFMVVATLTLLPIVTLIYFQIKFLPFHDVDVTYWHRFLIFADILLLFAIRPFIQVRYLRPKGRKLKLGPDHWYWEMSIVSLILSSTLSVLILFFSIMIATVPNETTDRIMASAPIQDKGSNDINKHRKIFEITEWLFEQGFDPITGKSRSWFSRNLIVTNKDLVADISSEIDEVSLSLRGRDLRYANLSGSDLHRADLSGADMRNIRAFDVKLQQARLLKTNLQGAFLTGANFQAAKLNRAQLQYAVLRSTNFQLASLIQAHIQGAELHNAKLRGANLLHADLQGSFLLNAKLQGANLTLSRLDGAILVHTNLQGTNIEGASFHGARLQGTNFWQTRLSKNQLESAIADFRSINLSPPTKDDRRKLEKEIKESLHIPRLQTKLLEILAPVLTLPPPNWEEPSKVLLLLKNQNRPEAKVVGKQLKTIVCKDRKGYTANVITSQILRSAGIGQAKSLKEKQQTPLSVTYRQKVLIAFLTALREKPAENCFGRKYIERYVRKAALEFSNFLPN